MSLNIRWYLTTGLPAQCDRHRGPACQLDASYQLHVTGGDGGDWFIDLPSHGPPAIRPGVEPARCTITMSSTTFRKLHKDPLASATSLHQKGKITVHGDLALFARFPRLFTLPA